MLLALPDQYGTEQSALKHASNQIAKTKINSSHLVFLLIRICMAAITFRSRCWIQLAVYVYNPRNEYKSLAGNVTKRELNNFPGMCPIFMFTKRGWQT